MGFGRPIISGIAVFKVTRTEGLSSARRLLRGYSSAPDPRRHIQQIHGALIHAQGWSPQQEALILAFGTWLRDHPSLSELKARTEALLGKLA